MSTIHEDFDALEGRTPQPEALARRGLIAGLFGLFAGAVNARAQELAPAKPKTLAASSEKPMSPRKARWGMAIDLDLCTACGACAVACRSENNVPLTEHGEPGAAGEHAGAAHDTSGTAIAWMELLERASGTPGAPPETLPLPCMHCEDAPCVKVCPTNATYVNEEGIVAQVWDRCIGCRYCMVACPYSRRYFNWKEPEWPESLRNLLNPDVATRPEGVVEKCTFCHHRIRRARETARIEERELEDKDVRHLTACAEACPAHAITFGDLDDSQSWVARLFQSPRAEKLLEHVGTKPKVVYLARERRSEG